MKWKSTKIWTKFSSSHSHVWLFACLQPCNPWTTARQAPVSITNSWSFLKLMSIELVMPSNHLILCRPLLLLPKGWPFPASGSFLMTQFFTPCGQSIGASAPASVLPMNTQGLFTLRLTGLISFSPRDSQESSNTTAQKHQFFSAQLSLWSNSHDHTGLLEKT